MGKTQGKWRLFHSVLCIKHVEVPLWLQFVVEAQSFTAKRKLQRGDGLFCPAGQY